MMDRPTPDNRATVLLLLAVAGAVDAIGLAETGRYFVSYMSGNTTQLGMLLARHDYAAPLMPLGLVALFVGGATLGTLLAEKAGRRAAGLLILTEAALLALAWQALGTIRPALGVILLPVAMGLANIVTLKSGSPQPGATYATGSLVKLGIMLAGLGRDTPQRDLLFQFAMWIALLFGSILGAFGRIRYGSAVLLGPAGLLVFLGLIQLFLSRRGTA